MIKAVLISMLAFYATFSTAQGHPYEIQFSHDIEQKIQDDSMRSSMAGNLLSFIGAYQVSSMYSDIPVSWGVDTLQISNYKVVPALSQIIEKAKKHRIVIISEHHLRPQHRIFAKEIIVALSQHGFTHLGMEALGHGDTTLNHRKYPLNHPISGIYTMEPQMGNLVRSAFANNYALFPYEATARIKGKDRDEIQAENIFSYLKQYPGKKVLIYCGFHHVIESDLIKRGSSFWMAKYLKDKTGIDPLTIYQDNFTEKYSYDEHPSLRHLTIDEPSLLIDEEGEIVRLSPNVDIEVIHPRTYYKSGRPNWLFQSEAYKAVTIDRPRGFSFPQIVSAYREDQLDGTPCDQIELKHKYDQKKLVLETGSYQITIFDGNQSHTYRNEVD